MNSTQERQAILRCGPSSKVARALDQERRGQRQAAEVRTARADIADEQSTDSPMIRQVVARTELQQTRAIVQIRIDEAAELELWHQRVDPVGAQEQRVPVDWLLLIRGIVADVPELPGRQ